MVLVMVAAMAVVVEEGGEKEEGHFELAVEKITRWLDNCCPGPLRRGGMKELNANTRRHENSLVRKKFNLPGQSVDVTVAAKPN